MSQLARISLSIGNKKLCGFFFCLFVQKDKTTAVLWHHSFIGQDVLRHLVKILQNFGGKTPGRLQPTSLNTAIYSVILEVSVCLVKVPQVDMVSFPVPALHEMQELLSWSWRFVLVSLGEILFCLLTLLPACFVNL